MGAVYFYHLTQRPLDATLPVLVGKAVGAGWRVLVRGTNASVIERLDAALWTSAPDSFVPHGISGGPHDADQPVLLTSAADIPADISCVMAVDGADVSASEVEGAERVCVLFDGNDPAAMDHARGLWKGLTDAGCAAQYWSEDNGRWEMKRESAGKA